MRASWLRCVDRLRPPPFTAQCPRRRWRAAHYDEVVMDDVQRAYDRRSAEYAELLGSMDAVHPADRALGRVSFIDHSSTDTVVL